MEINNHHINQWWLYKGLKEKNTAKVLFDIQKSMHYSHLIVTDYIFQVSISRDREESSQTIIASLSSSWDFGGLEDAVILILTHRWETEIVTRF